MDNNELNKLLSLIQTTIMGIALLGVTILILWRATFPVLLFIGLWAIFLGIFRDCLRDTFKAFGWKPRKSRQSKDHASQES